MFNYYSSPILTNCTFSGNSAGYAGGGVDTSWSNPKLTNCIFIGNTASGEGGGMYNYDGSPTLTNCTFSANLVTYGRGGGLCTVYGSAALINCIFSGNSANRGGGGVHTAVDNLMLTNCTFSGNFGHGMHNEVEGTPTVTNCIFWGNMPAEIYLEDSSMPVITYSNVQGGWEGDGNIDADPCFANPANSDYHLKSQAGRWDANSESWVQDDVTSPCIDAGNPGCPLGYEPNDVNNIRINMGAFGGTAEASKTPDNWRNIADLTNDWTVDFNDLKVFVDYWLDTGECIPSDLNRSQSVDFKDFSLMAYHWLEDNNP